MADVCPICKRTIGPDDGSCPSCGFKLLGSTEEFKPINLDDDLSEQKPKPRVAQSATLTIVRGPQLGTVYTLDDKILSIGRDPACDIFLNDMTVSREHATVFPSKGEFVIRDSSSFNGIWINNTNVDEAVLTPDDIIQIGSFCLLYDR